MEHDGQLGDGLLVAGRRPPGHRAQNRPDGLSPAGWRMQVVLNDEMPLQDYGCLMREDYDPFAVPPGG
ncbi:hypothetical protein [Streptacidiphilus rugosus]|uniref:hypothetical protein n=1 Tax=Streptacidiphilus rugosus TaxID=405783 RepID=UPI00056AAC4D|nr:hypothetical protein [Streptacidiphilus rugosus]